jgi:hypothetical protein
MTASFDEAPDRTMRQGQVVAAKSKESSLFKQFAAAFGKLRRKLKKARNREFRAQPDPIRCKNRSKPGKPRIQCSSWSADRRLQGGSFDAKVHSRFYRYFIVSADLQNEIGLR